jgi:lysophospholipase L1-like esterase
MGKYKTFGSRFDRVHRNDLNANFAAVEADINAQKGRVDELITKAPQPSEVVDARGGFPVLSGRLNDLSTSLAQKSNITDVRLKWTKLELEDMSETTLGAMSGNATFNLQSIPQNGSVTEEKTTLESTFKDITYSVEYLSGNKLINNHLIQSDLAVTRGSFTVTDGDIIATKDAVSFSFFYIPEDVSSFEFKLPATLAKTIYLVLGRNSNGDFHMLALNGASINKVYPVTSNGTVLGSLLSTITFAAPAASDLIRVRKDVYGLSFFKNGLEWFSITNEAYPGIYKNIFGFTLPSDWIDGSALVDDCKAVTRISVSENGIQKIEKAIQLTDGIWGSDILIGVDTSKVGNVNANFTKSGTIYSIVRAGSTYGWIYNVGHNKLHFKNTSNSPTYVVLTANGIETIALAIKGTSAGEVVKTTTTTLTRPLVKFTDVTPYVINAGDEILLTYSDYFVDIKIKRSGATDFVPYMTRDLSAIKTTIDTVGTGSVGLLTISGTATTVENFQIEIVGTIETKADQAYATALEVKNSVNIDPYFSTSKWGTMGDSITANSGGLYGVNYRTLVQNLLGIGLVNNVAVSGSMIARKSGYAQDANAMCVRFANLDNDCKIVTIFGGTNDYRGAGEDGIPLGVKGSTDVNVFYGALKVLIDGLITKIPSAKIAFITPMQRGSMNTPNAQGHILKDYVNAIKEMCADYSIPVLDMYNIGGLNVQNFATLTTDQLHPNTAGYEFISRKIAKFIDEL